MNPNIITISSDNTVKEAIKKMEDNNLSKLVVTSGQLGDQLELNKNNIKGILQLSKISPQDVSNNVKLGDLSLSSFKILGDNTKLDQAYPDIKTYPVVLVASSQNQNVSGVVTLTDYARARLGV